MTLPLLKKLAWNTVDNSNRLARFVPGGFLEGIEIGLICYAGILAIVVAAFGIHVIDHADGEQIEVTDADPQLDAAQQKERGGHFPLCAMKFFLDATSVSTFKPQS